MAGITRDTDSSGGSLTASQSTVRANGALVIVHDDAVAGHGDAPHTPQTIVAGSQKVFIGGTRVVKSGDGNSSCGHTAGGSDNVNVGAPE